MIDISTETRLTIPQAAARLGVSRETAYRYLQGIRHGYRLESLKIGGKRFTSVEACDRFVEAQNDDQPPERIKTRRERAKDHERAIAYLRKEGILK